MAEGAANLSVPQKKCAGHALNVAGGQSGDVALEPGGKQAIDALAIEILAPLSARETEGFVKLSGGIREARKIMQFVGKKKFCGALFGSEVDKGQPDAARLDLGTQFGELGDRLATEGSTEVAKEDQQ
jgi:hypothetical protein